MARGWGSTSSPTRRRATSSTSRTASRPRSCAPSTAAPRAPCACWGCSCTRAARRCSSGARHPKRLRDNTAVAERQFGPYRLVRQIAVGGMAEIHLAKTAGIAGFEKYVALKMIHPNFAEDEQFIQMLVDEAKIAVQLTHGNIAQTFDLGRVGDTYYITMEYVDGADLYKILRRASEQDREIPLDVCAFIGKEISSALDHAHRKRDHKGKPLGIVHRDVSPQNVLVSYSGEVKLVDFGIAKAASKVRQTAAGVIKGKYYYMSPEQARGGQIDLRSDIFSAGIVLYEMVAGQMLYLSLIHISEP